jgi:hypothetical protein
MTAFDFCSFTTHTGVTSATLFVDQVGYSVVFSNDGYQAYCVDWDEAAQATLTEMRLLLNAANQQHFEDIHHGNFG